MSDAACGCDASSEAGSICDCDMQGQCFCDGTCECRSNLCKEATKDM